MKLALSSAEDATFLFEAGDIRIETPVTRAAFEGWIAPELSAIDGAIDQVIERSGLNPDEIDRIFLTGGTENNALRGLVCVA